MPDFSATSNQSPFLAASSSLTLTSIGASIAAKIAKYCYECKQPIASNGWEIPHVSPVTAEKPITVVIAENLAHYMERAGVTQDALAQKSGVGQTTVGLYLHPERRLPSKSGKLPSPKVTELAQIAAALEIELWQIMRPVLNDAERDFHAKVEAAYRGLMSTK
jgi:transcriptional regulator with XRE-family HTH domain